jgi:hypothetical protein
LPRLRRSYRERFGGSGRFHAAVLLTIVVVTYLVVPWVVDLVDASRGYRPFYYEPKDFTRQDHLMRQAAPIAPATPWRTVVNAALVGLVVAVWLTVLPRRR